MSDTVKKPRDLEDWVLVYASKPDVIATRFDVDDESNWECIIYPSYIQARNASRTYNRQARKEFTAQEYASERLIPRQITVEFVR